MVCAHLILDRFSDWGKEKFGHVDHTLELVEWISKRYCRRPNLLGIQLLNEPAAWTVPLPVLRNFYEQGYRIVREHSQTAFVVIGSRVGGALNEWQDFMLGTEFFNVILDMHFYQVHDKARFGGMTSADHFRFARHKRLDEIRRLNQHPNLKVLVGEWSACLPRVAEPNDDDYAQFAHEQLRSYSEASAGWFFWNFKIDRDGYRHWDFEKAIIAGFLPGNVGPHLPLPDLPERGARTDPAPAPQVFPTPPPTALRQRSAVILAAPIGEAPQLDVNPEAPVALGTKKTSASQLPSDPAPPSVKNQLPSPDRRVSMNRGRSEPSIAIGKETML
jgi:hypothetical protein